MIKAWHLREAGHASAMTAFQSCRARRCAGHWWGEKGEPWWCLGLKVGKYPLPFPIACLARLSPADLPFLPYLGKRPQKPPYIVETVAETVIPKRSEELWGAGESHQRHTLAVNTNQRDARLCPRRPSFNI